MHDILVLLSFLYLWQTLQKILIILTYLDSIENILLLFCHFFHICQKKINQCALIKLLHFNIKLINMI